MKVTRQNALSTNEDGLTKEEVDAQRTDFSYDSSSEGMVWDVDKGAMVPKPAPVPVPTPQPNTPCLLYTSPSPRDRQKSRMPSSA